MALDTQTIINVVLALTMVGGFFLNWRKQNRSENVETHTVLAVDYKRLVEERAELRIETERLRHLVSLDVAELEARLVEAQAAAAQYRRERDNLKAELQRRNSATQ